MADLIVNFVRAANETACYNTTCRATANENEARHGELINNITANMNSSFDVIYFQVAVPLLFCSVTLLGVAGNLLVIYVIAFKRVAHTVTNLLLLNLAVADLSFVVICPPFTAYRYALLSWKVGNVACKLMHYLLNVTVYVTIYTLVSIAAVRHATVVYNKQTAWLRTRRNVIAACLGLWAAFAILNLPIPFLYGAVEVHGRLDCELVAPDSGRIIYVTFFIFAYVVPLMAIGQLSIGMLCYIRGRRRLRQRGCDAASAKRSCHRTRHVTRLVVAIVAVFAALWLPVHVHLLLLHTGRLENVTWVYEAVSVLWNLLAYVNSCIDPVVYTIASSEFRASFSEVLCCCCCCRLTQRRRSRVNTSDDDAFYDDVNGQTTVNNNSQLTRAKQDSGPRSPRSSEEGRLEEMGLGSDCTATTGDTEMTSDDK